MKRKLFIALIAVLAVSCIAVGCGTIDTKSPATVRFTVVSEAAEEDIAVVASAGKLTRDGKTITVALENRLPLYVSFSAEGYKTVTEQINAKDYSGDICERTVRLETPLSAVVELTVNAAGKVTCSDKDAAVTQKGSKYVVELPSRSHGDVTFTVTAEGYEMRMLTVTAAELSAGYVYKSASLVAAGKRLVELKNMRDFRPVITRNYDVVTPAYVKEGLYTLIFDADDAVVLDGVMIKGSDIPTYGHIVDFNEQGESGKSQRLYFAETDRYSVYPSISFFIETEAGITKGYVDFEWTYDKPIKGEDRIERRRFYVNVPGPCTLHALKQNGDGYFDETIGDNVYPYLDYVYDITAEDIETGMNIYDFGSETPVEPDWTKALYRAYKSRNMTEDGRILENTVGLKYVRSGQIIEGDYMYYVDYYALPATLEVQVEGDLSGAYFNCQGHIVRADADGRLTFPKFVPYKEGLFEILATVTDSTDADRPITVAEETFYIEYEELTKTGNTYTLNRKPVFHNFARVYGGRIDSIANNYLSLLPPGYDRISVNQIRLEPQEGSEDLIKTAGSEFFIRRDAKFKISISFTAYGSNRYGQGVFTSKNYLTSVEFVRLVEAESTMIEFELTNFTQRK